MQGLIVEIKANLYKIKVYNKIYEATARGKFKKDDMSPVVGDIVNIEVLDVQKNTAVIEGIMPRRTYIKRPRMANLTQVIFVVSSKDPKPDLLMLDKQLAFAEFLNLTSIIVLNKIDLDRKNEFNGIKEIYEKIGYSVLETNARERIGIDNLRKILKNNISAFSGNSGVGKSTLINSIFGDNLTIEGDISVKNKKGKNTTTNTTLYEIDNKSYIADTPGFSTFDISEISYLNLDKYFKELASEITNCQFIGCSHIKEEECGVKKALKDNKISISRYENYKRIYLELKDKEEHKW